MAGNLCSEHNLAANFVLCSDCHTNISLPAPPCLRCITNRSITYDAHFDGDKDVCQYKQEGDDELQTEVGHMTRQRDHVATVPLLKGVLRDQVPGKNI